VWILKFDSDTDVYDWMDKIYDRCPQMGGVSHPTGFSHRVHVGFDPVTGGFVGLPVEWERLLKGSALTKDDMAKNPQAVMEVLQFYTDKLQVRADDPKGYPSLSPTAGAENGKQLGYSNGVAPPRPGPPGLGRQESYQSGSSTLTPGSGYGSSSSRDQSTDHYKRADGGNTSDEERRKRDDQKRRQESERVRYEEEQERRRREEDREYNESLPKTKVPLAKQEIGGGFVDTSPTREASPGPGGKYNATRPAPPAPAGSKNGQAGSQLPIRNLQAQRPAPAPPGSQNGSSATTAKKDGGASSSYAVKQPATQAANGQPKKDTPPLTRKPSGSSGHKPSNSTQVKPLNVATKQPTGKPDGIKQAEAALTKKEPSDSKTKDVRMSAMSDAQVMERLRSVVTLSNPLESYNKQKKIGQGASGSVYVARIRETAPSKTAQDLIKMHGPRAQVAIKQMDLRSQPRKELIVNEIIVMKESRHDNIVNFLDAFLQEETFELWVIMEFMEGGALTDVIDNNVSISEDQIATICFEVSHPLAASRHVHGAC
jgi:protein-serine/threonine kinase